MRDKRGCGTNVHIMQVWMMIRVSNSRKQDKKDAFRSVTEKRGRAGQSLFLLVVLTLNNSLARSAKILCPRATARGYQARTEGILLSTYDALNVFSDFQPVRLAELTFELEVHY